MELGPKHKKRLWYSAAVGGLAGLTGLAAVSFVTGVGPVANSGARGDSPTASSNSLARSAVDKHSKDGGGSDIKEVDCDAVDLIQAILDANNAGGGTLNLAADCTYTLTNGVDGNGLPPIEEPVTIEGNNSRIERRSATEKFRIFHVVSGGTLKLRDVAVKHGNTDTASGGGLTVEEGGKAVLEHCTFAFNRARFNGGAIANFGITKIVGKGLSDKDGLKDGSSPESSYGKDEEESSYGKDGIAPKGDIVDNTAGVNGGGIYNDGALQVERARITYNNADDGGGIANRGALKTSKSEIGHNFAEGVGGGLYTDGIAKLTDTYVHDNTTGLGGGGIYNEAQLFLWNVKVNRNTATLAGGGIFNDEFGSLVADKSEINHNTTRTDGGGLYNFLGDATLRNSEVKFNKATNTGRVAGGIFNDDGLLRLWDTVVKKNVSDDPAGGLNNSGDAQVVGESEIIKNRPTNCEGSPNQVEGCFG